MSRVFQALRKAQENSDPAGVRPTKLPAKPEGPAGPALPPRNGHGAEGQPVKELAARVAPRPLPSARVAARTPDKAVTSSAITAPLSPTELGVPDVPFEPPFLSPRRPAKAPEPQPAPLPKNVINTQYSGSLADVIRNAKEIPFKPHAEALLVNPKSPRDAPAEEFRSLRTRLNHLSTQQPLKTLVVTSASPAEGKSFTAANLAITQAQLAGKRVLLADFDFRRPNVDKILQLPCAPGLTDYLQGRVSLKDVLYKVEGLNLYVLTAGDAVANPLELLNLTECHSMIEAFRENFDWVIIDSPPLLFAADGNLLSTLSDGTILVVRIGTTTLDSVTRAMQSLCENNVLGVVVNGARRSELYSKYSYYHDYYAPKVVKEDTPGKQDDDDGD